MGYQVKLFHDGGTVEVESSFATGAYCTIQTNFDDRREVVDKAGKVLRTMRVKSFRVSVNWSTTQRTVSQAVAALAHYREITEFAAQLETAFCGELYPVDPAPEEQA
jgi:hypothetical protein